MELNDKTTILVIIGIICASIIGGFLSSASAYQIIQIPDIHSYLDINSETNLTYYENYSAMINWTINNSKDKLVIFTGDIVDLDEYNQNTSLGWERFNNSLNQLKENNITYLISWGNHDFMNYNDTSIQQSIQSNITYQIINDSFGVITIPYNITEEELNLTKEILTNYSNYSFILVSHAPIMEEESLVDDPFHLDLNLSGRLVNNSNIKLVLSGHQIGNKIINHNWFQIIAGHNNGELYGETAGTLSVLDITNLNELNITTFSVINNKTIYKRQIKNNQVSILFPILVQPVYPVDNGHSSGGGGGSYTPKKINQSNITNYSIPSEGKNFSKDTGQETKPSNSSVGEATPNDGNAIRLRLDKTPDTNNQSIFQIFWNWVLGLFRGGR